MPDVIVARYNFINFRYGDVLEILPDWHAPSPPKNVDFDGTFQIRLNISGTKHALLKDLFLDFNKENKSVRLREFNNFAWREASEMRISPVKMVVVTHNFDNPEKSEITFESDRLKYSISNGGLDHKITSEGAVIIKQEFKIGPPAVNTPEGKTTAILRER